MIPTTHLLVLLLLLLDPGDGVVRRSVRWRRQDQQMSAESTHQITQELQAFDKGSNTTSEESPTVTAINHQLHQKAQLLTERSKSLPQVFFDRRNLPLQPLQVFDGRSDSGRHNPILFRNEPLPPDVPSGKWRRLVRTLLQDAATFLSARRTPQRFIAWLSSAQEDGDGNLHQVDVSGRRRNDIARQLPDPWYSVDTWMGAFQSSFKRDMVLNAGKLGAIFLLYYLAPDVLVWINDNFGLV